jgi:eukaryotic-like serine/threonine-protein kinase
MRRDETDPDRTGVSVVDPLVGTVLDRRYQIEFRLAAGGFGAIYRATHVINGREIALKVLHTKLATEPDVVARFRREAAALGALRDPHTITSYDFGETRDGTLYIAMELLQGESLYERFRALGPLPWPRVVAIARQVCSSLAEAHALGIVHRDLKPTNIHLEHIGGDPDFVKVLDFGIAKILHGSALDTAELTHTGQMVGTFDYMSPEQMVGGAVTARSDIYSLGVVMFEMTTGERPFGDPPTPAAMLTAIVTRNVPSLTSLCDAPPALDVIVARCLDRDPQKRFADVPKLAQELDRMLALAADVTKTLLSPVGDDSTWVDDAPEGASHDDEGRPTVPRVAVHATLPGIVPPERSTPWPLQDPRRKR